MARKTKLDKLRERVRSDAEDFFDDMRRGRFSSWDTFIPAYILDYIVDFVTKEVIRNAEDTDLLNGGDTKPQIETAFSWLVERTIRETEEYKEWNTEQQELQQKEH